MTRLAVPLLLAAFAAPAAAQAPADPQPPRPRPIPLPDAVPAQPGVPFVVPAQPGQPVPPQFVFPPQNTGRMVQGGGEPRVVVAKVVDGSLVWKTTQNAPGGNRVVTTTVMENGQPVTRQLIVGGGEPTTRESKVSLDGLKVTDIAGKKVRATSLEMRLGDGKGIVLHSGPVSAELRAMFKEDTLFVETGPGGGVMMPGFAPAPVQLDFVAPPGGLGRPLGIPGGAPPAPTLPRATPAPVTPPPAPPAPQP